MFPVPNFKMYKDTGQYLHKTPQFGQVSSQLLQPGIIYMYVFGSSLISCVFLNMKAFSFSMQPLSDQITNFIPINECMDM